MDSQSKPQTQTLELDSTQLFLTACQSLQLPPPSLPLPPSPLSIIPHSKLIPNTRFLVDAFRHAGDFSVSYFLSHFHSDHYTGLSSTWSRGIIFCSPTTALLLLRILNIPSPFIHPLPLHQPFQIDGSRITLIDANHCPGAVQFLFEVPSPDQSRTFRRYVHTGDFRFSPSMITEPALAPFIGADTVFLDTTYCHPKFVFPSQEESVNYVVDIVSQCDSDGVLFLVATYVVGKERVLLELARKFGKKVHVDARKMEVLRVLGYGESGEFTEDGLETNIHVVGWNVLGETWPYFRPNFVVGFVPTGWTYEVKHNRFAVRSKDSCQIHLVPYSEHSNYDELREYVRFLRPKRVVPTVGLDVEKSDSKHADKRRKHFAGLVDETANKQEFLRGFKQRDSGEVGFEVDKEVSDALEPGQGIEKEVEPSDVGGDKSINPDIAMSLSSFMGETCIRDPTLLNDEEKEKVIQELTCCLPTWVTRSQVLDLISTTGSNVVEAVSNFYERETEFHDQVNSSQISVSASKCCSSNDTDLLLKSCLNTGNTYRNVDILPSQDSKLTNLRHTVPSHISSSKRKRCSESKPNKKVKVKAKSESSGSKQSTITKFFCKVMPVMPGDTQSDQFGSNLDESPKVEDLLPTDVENLYKDEIDQFMQIINGNESLKKQAITFVEKAKGDINKALDIYYCNSGNFGENEISVQEDCKIDGPLDKKYVSQELRVLPDISMHGVLRDNVDATHVSLPPQKYNPKEHACWRDGQPAPYSHLARAFNLLEDEKGKIKATSILCNMFRSLLALSPADVLPAVYLCTNKIAADHENVELNIGGSLVTTALEEACGTNRLKIREMYIKFGDLGDVAQECRQTQRLLVPPTPLLVKDVHSALRKISVQTGNGSTLRKKGIIVHLMRSCREKEIKFLVRTLVRNLRIGAMLRTVLPALAHAVVMNSCPSVYQEGTAENLKERLQVLSMAVVEAYNILPNLDIIVPSLMNKGVEFSVSSLSMVPGIPIKPMLAKITNGIPQALKLFQNKAFTCEYNELKFTN